MDTIDVYAMNIQPSQIIKRLVFLSRNSRLSLSDIDTFNKDDIEKERAKFKDFLVKCAGIGRTFRSQLDAWKVYDFEDAVYAILRKGYIPSKAEDEMSKWEKEMFDLAYEFANQPHNLANYDERKAQK